MVLTVDGSGMKSTILEGTPALAAVALDVLGRTWVAATGRIWVNEAGDDWQPAWEDPNWRSPFVSLIAEIGFVAGMTVDGGVVECHSTSPSFGDLVR
jgi:hypothetical protein